MKVLIVEDNQAMRRMIRRMVAEIANDISECGDGATACSLYGEFRPDWVLMDIEMGEVNGIVATKRIKTDYPDACIIIVTDYADPLLREAARQAGACGYVLKEDLHQLAQMLTARPALAGPPQQQPFHKNDR
jgi:CheY-like chemotaxis protein